MDNDEECEKVKLTKIEKWKRRGERLIEELKKEKRDYFEDD